MHEKTRDDKLRNGKLLENILSLRCERKYESSLNIPRPVVLIVNVIAFSFGFDKIKKEVIMKSCWSL